MSSARQGCPAMGDTLLIVGWYMCTASVAVSFWWCSREMVPSILQGILCSKFQSMSWCSTSTDLGLMSLHAGVVNNTYQVVTSKPLLFILRKIDPIWSNFSPGVHIKAVIIPCWGDDSAIMVKPQLYILLHINLFIMWGICMLDSCCWKVACVWCKWWFMQCRNMWGCGWCPPTA